LCFERKKSFAVLNSLTVGDTSPEIIAKDIKRKKITDMSIAAPLFLFIFVVSPFFFSKFIIIFIKDYS
ncbi:MAG: hypothetical protein ABIS26_02685, partial [Candidatus Paceibacterota bacterium]